jgi:hypothetical protein
VVDTIGIQQGSAALDAMHFIPLFEQELSKIGTVLTGDAGDQSSFQEGVLLFTRRLKADLILCQMTLRARLVLVGDTRLVS